MKRIKSLAILLTVSTFAVSCNVSNTPSGTKPSGVTTPASAKPGDKVVEKQKGLNLTYENKDGKVVSLTKNNILSYKLGTVEKKEFGCSGCPTLDGDIIVYNGKSPITFKLKINPKQNFTGDGAPSFFTKAEGDDAGAGEAEDTSVVVPYNLYRSVDEDFSNNGLIYNIKQKLKSDKKKFSKKAVDDELIFETSGSVLGKDNKVDTSKPVVTQSSDEPNISVFGSDGKVSEFKTTSLQTGNTKPDVVREQTPEEKAFLKDTQESLSNISKDVVKPDEPRVIPAETPASTKPVDAPASTKPAETPASNKPTDAPASTKPSDATTPASSTPTSSTTAVAQPVSATEGCVIKLQPQDQIKGYIQKQILEQNCKVVIEEPSSSCVFRIRKEDLPLKPYIQSQIDSQKCQVIVE